MSFPHFVWPMNIAVYGSLIYSVIYLMSMDSPCSNLGNTKMFLLTTTKMSKSMTIHPSHIGCVKSSILTWLKQMYIDSSCPNLEISIKLSDVLIGQSLTLAKDFASRDVHFCYHISFQRPVIS